MSLIDSQRFELPMMAMHQRGDEGGGLDADVPLSGVISAFNEMSCKISPRAAST